MLTTPPSAPVALDARSDEDPLIEEAFEQSEISSGLAAPLVPSAYMFDQTVAIYPIDAVKRHSTRRYGVLLESIYAPAQSKIEFQFRAPFHLLVMYAACLSG
jgi:hypothetical protein